ncbi:hypothetical protein QWY84_15585 [Aquisalimonas lutea]|uniref:hypothetical protein n=1 Tax=Aquisalimonas lutea TaxID=1327750 RepID=UPI0025B49A19|nr:hypothetical protein [Aquisalimonas lutea]MDN3519040.1 hypothetical protein [Aquisalimonas lutea]
MAARLGIVLTAIVLDLVVLAGFLWVKAIANPFVLLVALVAMAAILIAAFFFPGGMTDTTPAHFHTS